MLVQVTTLGDEEEVFCIPVREASQQPLHEQVPQARLGQARGREGVCSVIWDQEVKQSLEKEERIEVQQASSCTPTKSTKQEEDSWVSKGTRAAQKPG